MPRMRTIKPGFFQNEELVELEPLARILFAGLWCWADREGRLEDRPRRLRAEILPYDQCDVDALLEQLAGRGFIVRYVVEAGRHIQIVNFCKHQNPHYKETASAIPPPPNHTDSAYVAFGVPAEQRRRILERDGHRCVECGATEQLTIDHIEPRSRGGSGEDDNLQTLCRAHNTAKGNRLAAASSAEDGSSNGRPSTGLAGPAMGHGPWVMGHGSWGEGSGERGHDPADSGALRAPPRPGGAGRADARRSKPKAKSGERRPEHGTRGWTQTYVPGEKLPGAAIAAPSAFELTGAEATS